MAFLLKPKSLRVLCGWCGQEYESPIEDVEFFCSTCPNECCKKYGYESAELNREDALKLCAFYDACFAAGYHPDDVMALEGVEVPE